MVLDTPAPKYTLNRGDTFERVINIKDSNGDLVDASGWTIYFTVRDSTPDTATTDDSGATISKTLSGTSSGQVTLTVDPDENDIEPKVYYFDFQVKKANGNIHSTMTGYYEIKPDTTRAR